MDRYLARLGRELAPLQAVHGGPIIAVRVENEYGTFGNDRLYMEAIRQSMVRAGFGDSILFTSDGAKFMMNDALPGVLPVINFGPHLAETSYARRFLAMIYLASTMRSFRFEQPWMTGEYWAGWYDAWGGHHDQPGGIDGLAARFYRWAGISSRNVQYCICRRYVP